MFVCSIVHHKLCAPQKGLHVYLAMHLLQRLKFFRVEDNPEPSLGIRTAFYRERNNRRVSCLPRTKQLDNFLSTVFDSNEHGQSFPVFVG